MRRVAWVAIVMAACSACLPSRVRSSDGGDAREDSANDAADDASADVATDLASDAAGDVASDAASDVVSLDATNDVTSDAVIDVAADGATDSATEVVALDAEVGPDAVVDVVSEEASFDARPEAAVLDAPAEIALPDAPPEATVLDAPVDATASDAAPTSSSARFVFRDRTCLPSGSSLTVDLVLDRVAGDMNPYDFALSGTNGIRIPSGNSVRIDSSVSRVAVTVEGTGMGPFELRAMITSPSVAPGVANIVATSAYEMGALRGLDCTFGAGGIARLQGTLGRTPSAEVRSLDVLGDGSVVAGGRVFDTGGGNTEWGFWKVSGAGALDGEFGTAGHLHFETGLNDNPEAFSRLTVERSSGSIYAVGYGRRSSVPGMRGAVLAIARVSARGVLDTGFAGSGASTVRFITSEVGMNVNDNLLCVAVAPDMSVYAAGYIERSASMEEARDQSPTLVRVASNGALLPLRTSGPMTETVARELRIMGAGLASTSIEGMTLDGSNRPVLVGFTERDGRFERPAPNYERSYVARFDPNTGGLDTSFNNPTTATSPVRGVLRLDLGAGVYPRATAVAVLATGAMVLAGEIEDGRGVSPALFRVSASGALENWSGTTSPVLRVPCSGDSPGYFNAISVHAPTQRIAAVGSCGVERWASAAAQDTLVFVADSSGAPVPGFGVAGAYQRNFASDTVSTPSYDEAFDVRFDGAGRIVAAITAIDVVSRRTGGAVIRLSAPAP